MDYLLLSLSILSACANNLVLRFLPFKNIKSNPFLFNALISLIWIIVLLIYNLGIKGFSTDTLIYGVIYGVVLSVLLLSKTIAIAKGPVSIATLLGAASFVITNLFNAIYWKENMGAFEISGIILMLIAVILMTFVKEKDSKLSISYILSLILILISASLVGIVFRFHQSSADAKNSSEMLMIAGLTSSILSFIFYFVTRKKIPVSFDWKKRTNKERWIYVIVILLTGILSCLYCRLNIYLVGVLPSSIFFPVFNGLDIAVVSILGYLIYKEKLSWQKIIGCVLGLFAILLVSHFFGAVSL